MSFQISLCDRSKIIVPESDRMKVHSKSGGGGGGGGEGEFLTVLVC